MKRLVSHLIVAAILVIFYGCSNSNETDAIDPVAALYSGTQVIGNIEYAKVDSTSLFLDAYIPAKKLGEPPWVEYSNDRKPTVLFLHGGGWRNGDKISRSLFLMPFVQKGWCVITADYRMLDKTDLKGCIGDSRLALNWIYDNASKYKFDTSKIIVTGESAGGHLSLMTGLISNDSIFQQGNNKITRPLKVAGIINWFGVADLAQASKTWDSAYLKAVVKNANADTLLRIASPITYLGAQSPPIMTIHGDQDHSAPYDQAILLHDKLKALGVKNYFMTIPGKKHGNFDGAEMTKIYAEIWKFLKEAGIQNK